MSGFPVTVPLIGPQVTQVEGVTNLLSCYVVFISLLFNIFFFTSFFFLYFCGVNFMVFGLRFDPRKGNDT